MPTPGPHAEEIAEIGLGNLGGVGEHALRRLAAGLALESCPGDVQQRHPARCGDLDDVADRWIAFELGADPHLVHLAPLGDQQLAHRLATLDLTPTEPLRPTAGSTGTAAPTGSSLASSTVRRTRPPARLATRLPARLATRLPARLATRPRRGLAAR